MRTINPESLRPGDILGGGREKNVYRDTENPEQVVGLFHEQVEESPETVKGRYYLTKIVRELLPGVFPDFHQASADPHAFRADRVHVRSEDPIVEQEQRRAIIRQLDDLGIEIDQAFVNFRYDEDDQAQYVDTLVPWIRVTQGEGKGRVFSMYDPEKIKLALQGVPELERAKLETYLARLEELFEQESKTE